LRPRIAVTTTLGVGGSHQLPAVKLNVQYVTAVEEPGGTALLVTPAHDADSIRALVAMCHGLLLTGGEDVDPARYGQAPHPALGSVTPARDEAELTALDEALRLRMPVLAVCRGVQLLNVALGGTLFQDLPSQRPGPVVHEQEAPVAHRWHGATVREGSRLHAMFGVSSLFINSFHHQGIDRLADGLAASVWAEDGLVEGVEGTDHPWMYGVQWHPERGEARARTDARDPDRRLLWAFVEAARRFAEPDADGEWTRTLRASAGGARRAAGG
jgi:putative glutamine amidotransferase